MDNNSIKDNRVDFDYSTKESRENTICLLFNDAKTARTEEDAKRKVLNSYYRCWDAAIKSDKQFIGNDNEILQNFDRAGMCLTDAYIQIETQINPSQPEPIFTGRDAKEDSAKAKEREYVVKYILARNDMAGKRTKLEKIKRKYGDCFVKAYWRGDSSYTDGASGDIYIDVCDIDNVYPDPTAKTVDECEYIDYAYYMHRQKAKRLFKKDLKKAKIDIDNIVTDDDREVDIDNKDLDNTVQILEHWYRDDEGDIALSILINDTEIRHIDKFWVKTNKSNKNYPFVQYGCIESELGFWNTSEIEVILPWIKIGNNKLNAAIENDELMNNSQWVVEKDSLADDSDGITNEPGGVIVYEPGHNAPQRVDGIRPLTNVFVDINQIQTQIQRTLSNYDTNTGAETQKATTASGLAMLRADSAEQSNIKDYPSKQADKKLFQLLDWLALEFYDDDRLIFIGTPNSRKNKDLSGNMNIDANAGDIFFTYNSNEVGKPINEEVIGYDDLGQAITSNDGYYYPSVDCDIIATDGIEKNKTYILNTLVTLTGIALTQDNYKMMIKVVEEMGLPQSNDIIEEILATFEPTPIEGASSEDMLALGSLTPEQKRLVQKKPELLELARRMGSANVQQQEQKGTAPAAKVSMQGTSTQL